VTVDIAALHRLLKAAESSTDPPGKWIPREPLTPQRELLCAAVNALPDLLAVYEAAQEWREAPCDELPLCERGDHEFACAFHKQEEALIEAVDAVREISS